ncbi:hypothetical protein D3C71_1707610 [compost metagenome]
MDGYKGRQQPHVRIIRNVAYFCFPADQLLIGRNRMVKDVQPEALRQKRLVFGPELPEPAVLLGLLVFIDFFRCPAGDITQLFLSNRFQ